MQKTPNNGSENMGSHLMKKPVKFFNIFEPFFYKNEKKEKKIKAEKFSKTERKQEKLGEKSGRRKRKGRPPLQLKPLMENLLGSNIKI